MSRNHRERPIRRENPSGKVVWVARYTDRYGKRKIAKPPWNDWKGTFDREYKAQEAIDWAYKQNALPESETVGGYFSSWIELHPRSRLTNETNEYRIRAVLDVEVEGVPFRDWMLRDLRRRQILVLVDVMLREQERAQTGATNILRSLSAMCEDAITDEKAEVNPVRGVKVRATDPRIQKQRRPIRVWTFEQMHAFAAAGDKWETLIRTFSDTGMRMGEVIPLYRSDLKDGMFHVRRTADDGRIMDGTKTDHWTPNAGRVVPCPPTLEAMIKALPTRIDTPLIHPNHHGKIWRKRNFYDVVWYPTQKASGLDIRPHEMRHSYITHLRVAGIQDADLAAVTGHTIETMLGNYTHAIGASFDEIKRAIG